MNNLVLEFLSFSIFFFNKNTQIQPEKDLTPSTTNSRKENNLQQNPSNCHGIAISLYPFNKPKNPRKKISPHKSKNDCLCAPPKKKPPSCVSQWTLQQNGCRLVGRSISCWVCQCHLDCQSASLVILLTNSQPET